MYKTSNFNIEKELSEGLLVYNSFTSGVLFLNSNYSKQYKHLKENGNSCDKDLIDNLLSARMIVDCSVDEVNTIKILNNAARFSNDSWNYTIAPTMECNFACPYCFEEGVRYNRMSPQTEEKVVEFIRDINGISENQFLGITWYGGEPLMGFKSIKKISQAISSIDGVKERYSADIITNGYYLTRPVAQELVNLKIFSAQITLDGPPDTHNKRRVPLNGRPTFNTILENIKNCCDLLNIIIRVNVDKTNIDSTIQVLHILKENNLKDKVRFYVAVVDDYSENQINTACLSDKEFSTEELKIYIAALKMGFNLIHIPGNILGICGAVSTNSYVIDPLGDLYKCWNEIGRKEKSVGNISSGPKFNKILTSYLNYEALDSEECFSCPVLPSCMGGCPYTKMNTGENRCSSILYNSDKVMELAYRNAVQSKK